VRYPLLFLIFPPVMLAAMRGNFAGTAFVTIIVVVIAATFTSLGRGPLMLMSPAGPDSSTYLVLQFFIGVLLLTSFPVVVAMSNWRRNQRTERQLRNHLRLLADNSLDVIVLTDLEGRRLYVSPSVREVLGQQPEDFLRGTFRDLVSSTSREALQQQLGQLATKQRGKATITFPHRHADGRKLWLEARVRHFRDADLLQMNATTEPDSARDGDRREEGFVVTLRDISRRREAEQALEAANRKLSSLVWQDGLTGLGNRRQFDKALAESWEQCRLAGAPLSVILLDVDHFKRYNDHYGHLEGDLCLARVAKVIGESTRQEQDCAARYGGEEFALILPQTGARDATLAAERLRLGIRELALPHAGSPLDCVTVSLGMASCVPRTEDRPEDLVNAADKALYAGKAGGRNRVAIIDGLQSEPQLQERAD
jgi:diguanylate cyclase (GGDEF)-like protein/PAS domain S-box-containing protein